MKKNDMKPVVDLMGDSIKILSKLIDKKHYMNCNTCGQLIDMRDLSQVFAHEPCKGFVNYETMEKIPHSSSRKIGDPILYTKNNGNINLN